MKTIIVNEDEKNKFLQSYFWPVLSDKASLLDDNDCFCFEENIKEKKILNIFFNNNNPYVLKFLREKLLKLDQDKRFYYIVLYPSDTAKAFNPDDLESYYGSVVLYREDVCQKNKEDVINGEFVLKRNALSDKDIQDICNIWNELFHTPFYQEIKYYAAFEEIKNLLKDADNFLFYQNNDLVGHISLKKNLKPFYKDRNISTEVFMYLVDHRVLDKSKRIIIHKYLHDILADERLPYMVAAISKNKKAIDLYKKLNFTPKFYTYTLRD
ncbi:MAG: hypothetical protein HQK50_01190 [Oligoflexia bacterium]|nr:hypothetical protein [Oligoflexia bacterium]